MKRIILGITILVLMFCLNTEVYAKSYSVAITGNDTFEDQITLNVVVNNLVDFNGACEGLCGMTATLNYDSSKLELVSITKLNDFGVTHNKGDNSLVFERDMGVGSGSGVATMVFRNKGLSKDESTSISLSNIVATDGEEDVGAGNASKSVKFIVKEVPKEEENNNNNNNTGNNNQNNNTNTGNNNNTNTGTTNKKEEPKKSNNNYLASVTLSKGKINFDKEQLTYDVVVEYDVDTIEIKATTEDEKAVIEGLKNKYKLSVGENTINLVVKAEDDSERTYTIKVNREEKDIVVEEENQVVDNDSQVEKSNNMMYIIIICVLIVVIVVLSIFLLKNKRRY